MSRTDSSEEMRRALIQMLVSEMEASFARTQEERRSQGIEATETSEEELESLVGEAIRTPRRN
ncbi:MAG: hypothetical protein ABR577_14825 [Pyrinomonadaceae bacterium]